MNETTLIPLGKIEHNRYQGRKEYTDIDALGRSIATNDLEQSPKARLLADGAYELKFGHRRFEAFKWLSENWQAENLPERYDGYTVMPLIVEEMTDVQMYEGMVIENEQRQDLNDIEKAQVIREYRSTFGKSSAEAGALLGMNEATVRGIERFLDLPAAAQKALAEKKITQGTARLLLSAQKLGGDGLVKEALKELLSADSSMTPEDVIEHEVDRLKNVYEMHGGWQNRKTEKPRAGRGLWLLDMKNFPNKMLPHLAPGDLVTFGILKSEQLTTAHTNYLLGLQDGYMEGLKDGNSLNTELKAIVDHLVNPPTCTACPFYTVINKNHYCGLKACHERKAEAFRAQKMGDLSRTVKIPIYAKADGSYLVLDDDVLSHKKAFESRHADLRLLPAEQFNGYAWQRFEGLDGDIVKLVAVGNSLDKLAVKSSKGKTVGKKSEKETAEARAVRLYRQVRKELMWGYACEAQGIFAGVPMAILERLCEWHFIGIYDRIPDEYDDQHKRDKDANFQRRALVWRLIMEHSNYYARFDLVNQLKAFEKQTTVKPSKELLKRAVDWDAQIRELASVAVETKGKK